MTLSIKTIETKKEELENQFNQLADRLKELEQASIKVKADATAINGAIQVCNQLIEENKDGKEN